MYSTSPQKKTLSQGTNTSSKNGHAFVNAVIDVAQIDLNVFRPPVILRAAKCHMLDPPGVPWHSAGNGIVFRSSAVGDAGQDQLLVREHGPRLVKFRAPQYDAILAFLNNPEVHVGIWLLVGGYLPIALGIGYGRAGDEVVPLHVFEPVHEVVMIGGALFPVDLGGDVEQRGVSILNAAERTHPQLPVAVAGDLNFGDQVVYALGNMLEP